VNDVRKSLLGLLTVIALPSVPARAEAPPAIRADARAIFEQIISMKTSEGLGQVPVMARYLADRFRAGGFPADDIHVLPSGETAALVVRYRGSGKGGKPILLLAHMDVVTAKREDWERDPFKLVEQDGYFYGRGTLDIKNEVALLTETFLRLKAENFVPSRDLIIAFTGDEETQAVTTTELATRYRALIDAEFALNGDGGQGVLNDETGRPEFFLLQGAEKAYASFDVTTRNPGGHSSQPRADNAIYDLLDALRGIRTYEFPVMWNDWTIGGFKAAAATRPGEIGAAMAQFAAHPGDPAAAATLSKVPSLVGRVRTTCVPTMLKGGHADNALPQSASATVNCRIFPGTSFDEVVAALQKAAGPGAKVTMIGTPTRPGPPSPMRDDVVAAVTQAVHAIHPGVPIVPDQAPYATDGSIFRAAGIPTYGVASYFMKPTEAFPHGLNERITVAAFYEGLDYWYVLLKTLTGGN